MKRILFVLLILSLPGAAASANIAIPVEPPSPAGDILGFSQGLEALRIEREDLLLDMSGRTEARSRARYLILNPLSVDLKTDLYFITPYMQDVKVTVDQKSLDPVSEKLSRARVPWKISKDEYHWWPKDQEMEAFRFPAEFKAGKKTVIEVSFRLPAGYDNRNRDSGMYPAQAGHALNWSKMGDIAGWYIYSLESANTFKGGLGELRLEIVTAEGWQLEANVSLPEKKTEGGLTYHTAVFSGFPVPAIEAKVKYRASYNVMGGTFSLGLATDFAAYTEFMCQALFDVYFYNHQFSAGIEGNPFGAAARLKIPVLYTFVFGDRTSAYEAFLFDVRLSAGALIDLLPASAAGIRLAVGLRLTLEIFELAYDFYPFDPALGYVGRMTFLFKVSI